MIKSIIHKIKILTGKYNLDRADLVQTIIIIAGFAVAAIVAIGAVNTVLMDKGEKAAKCIANNSFMDVGVDFEENCEGDTEPYWELEGHYHNHATGKDYIRFKAYYDYEKRGEYPHPEADCNRIYKHHNIINSAVSTAKQERDENGELTGRHYFICSINVQSLPFTPGKTKNIEGRYPLQQINSYEELPTVTTL